MNEEINNLMKSQAYKRDGYPAIFCGQTFTRLVQGRSKWKIINRYCPSTEESLFCKWEEDHESDRELSELEVMYKEFCKKAHNYLIHHNTNQGEKMAHKIVFPDFYYEIIPNKFPIK